MRSDPRSETVRDASHYIVNLQRQQQHWRKTQIEQAVATGHTEKEGVAVEGGEEEKGN